MCISGCCVICNNKQRKIKMHTNWDLSLWHWTFFFLRFLSLFAWQRAHLKIPWWMRQGNFGAQKFFSSLKITQYLSDSTKQQLYQSKIQSFGSKNFWRCAGFLFHTNTELRKIYIFNNNNNKANRSRAVDWLDDSHRGQTFSLAKQNKAHSQKC